MVAGQHLQDIRRAHVGQPLTQQQAVGGLLTAARERLRPGPDRFETVPECGIGHQPVPKRCGPIFAAIGYEHGERQGVDDHVYPRGGAFGTGAGCNFYTRSGGYAGGIPQLTGARPFCTRVRLPPMR